MYLTITINLTSINFFIDSFFLFFFIIHTHTSHFTHITSHNRKITLEQVRRAQNIQMSLSECLQMEYRMCQTLMTNIHSDFYEGIRAVLVDKDRNPQWNPSSLEQVTKSDVNKFFQHLSKEDELFFDD